LAHRLGVETGLGYLHPIEQDFTLIDRLQQVHAAQQRRFARTRCPDQTDGLPLGDIQTDALADLVIAEALSNRTQLQHQDRSACWRAIKRSAKRVAGMVMARKMQAATT